LLFFLKTHERMLSYLPLHREGFSFWNHTSWSSRELLIGGFTVTFCPCRYVRFRAGAPATAKFTPAEKFFPLPK
jgi:hypothetical protein